MFKNNSETKLNIFCYNQKGKSLAIVVYINRKSSKAKRK